MVLRLDYDQIGKNNLIKLNQVKHNRADKRYFTPPLYIIIEDVVYKSNNWSLSGLRCEGKLHLDKKRMDLIDHLVKYENKIYGLQSRLVIANDNFFALSFEIISPRFWDFLNGLSIMRINNLPDDTEYIKDVKKPVEEPKVFHIEPLDIKKEDNKSTLTLEKKFEKIIENDLTRHGVPNVKLNDDDWKV